MKTFLKIFAIIIIIILAAAFILPIAFKGKIMDLAQKEINKNVAAKVDFSDISLSLFKSFPNFNMGIKDLTIVGIETFENDTLANISLIDITLDLMSVIKGESYEIKKIKITSPQIFIQVLKDGSANYDIAVATEETDESVKTPESETAFNLTLRHFEISDAIIDYIDESMGMELGIMGMNHTLSGNFTADVTTIKTKTNINSLTLNYEGIKYLNNARFDYDANIEADLKNEIYTLSKNNLKLNEIILQFAGSVSMIEEDINLVLTFESPKTEFKHLLSMVPAIYSKDFESIQTSGKLSFDGHVKGLYNETNLPAFNVNLAVSDAMFKYPDLPESVSNVNINTTIKNKGGDADNTIIDVSKFHLQMGQNPVDISLNIKTPVSDPDIKAYIKGKLNLADVKNYYPIEEGDKLSGSFIADVTIKGKLSAVENERYDEFTALGSMLVKGLQYESSEVNGTVEVSNAQLNFSPAYLDLVSFNLKIGENDLNAKGKIENYLAYIFTDDILTGNLNTQSNYFNLLSLMPEELEDGSSVSPQENPEEYTMSVIEIPANIDFLMISTFKKLIYDNYEFENVNGRIKIKDERLNIENLSMNLLDGEMNMSGYYTAIDPLNPEFDFNLNIDQIDIQRAYNTFGTMTKYAPIAQKTSGKFSTQMRLKSILDQEMMPVYESMLGNGKLQTTKLTIQDVNTLNKLSDVLKYEKLKRMVIDKILVDFKFIDGKLLIEPFDMKVNNYKATLGGWTGIDESIDYALNLEIPRSEFGSAANDFLNGMVKQANDKGANFTLGDMVSLGVGIGGTLSNPSIKTNLKESGKSLVEDVKKQIKEEIENKKEELKQEAKEQAQKILNDANKQADKLVAEAKTQAAKIKKEAGIAAKKINDEAEIQAKKLEDEGKKNGFLAETAAKEAAKKLRKEAKAQADNLVNEADKQANGIVNKANTQAAKIKQDAQKEADKILEGK